MEKELFRVTLLDKAKSANNNAPIDNLSERTINEVVSMFHPLFSDDEKITDDSWQLPVQMVKTLSGQLRHDTSVGINDFKTRYEAEQKDAIEKAKADAVASFKAEWEKSHPAPDEVPKDSPKNSESDIAKLVAEQVALQMKGLTGADSEFGKLSKQFSDYLQLQAAKDKAATEADVREQVKMYLLSRGVDEDDFALDYTLEKLVIGDNPDVAALKSKAEKDYESNYKRIHKHDGGRPFAGGGEGGSEGSGAAQWLKGRDKLTQTQAESAAARKKLLK